MTPELWKRLQPLYDAALDIPSENHAAFVDEVCKGDHQLKKELQDLLVAHDEETGTLDNPIFNVHPLMPPREQTFADGTVLLGRFRIVRLLGSGGMGEVYEAIDTQLGRIALKTVIGDITASSERLLRFRKEVQLARDVSNPHVCRIHELFLTEGSEGAFVTMEFLNGVTLADKIRESGPLPWREARTVALELCDALQSIHEAEIIHRDLKTRNIMLASRGGGITTVLMDFGIARRLSHQSGDTSTGITIDGTIVGTPDYMAPEQFEGKESTPATDIYALGVVLYEVATGKRPVRDDPNKARNGKTKPLTRPSSLQPGIPRRFDEVVCKCLEYDPERRYQSAKEVERAIRLPSLLLHIQQKPLTAAASVLGAVAVLSSLLLVPAIGERARGILFSSSEKHIAILPFDVTAGSSPETQALADGLMDSLTGGLSNADRSNRSLWVVPASEVRARKVTSASAAMREFGATIVVEGGFERYKGETHLKLTVVDPKNTREVGFVDVHSEAEDLVGLQQQAMVALERLMNISISQVPDISDREPPDRAAYEDYLAGIGYYQRYDKPGNLDLAIQSLDRSIRKDSTFALAYASLARIYSLKFRLESDPKWIKEAEINGKRAAELDDRLPSIYVALGEIHNLTGNHALAIQEFQHALNLDPRDPGATTGIAASYKELGKNRDAETAYSKASSLRPEDWKGYNDLGIFFETTGQPLKAIPQFKHALLLTPDNSWLYVNLAVAYMGLDDYKMLAEAERALNKSILINPTFGAYANLGVLYGEQHRFGDSAKASQAALLFNDQLYDIWYNLTDAYEWLGSKADAARARVRLRSLLERAITIDPEDGEAQATIAVVYAEFGLRQEAKEHIRTAIALSPNDAYIFCEAADVAELLGSHKRAVNYLGQAMSNGLGHLQMGSDFNLRAVVSDFSIAYKAPAS